jgi:deoxyribonuclease-1
MKFHQLIPLFLIVSLVGCNEEKSNTIIQQDYFIINNKKVKRSFDNAKVAIKQIYQTLDAPEFYAGCPITYADKPIINYNDCKFQPRTYTKNIPYPDVEHKSPASLYGQNLMCWQDGKAKDESSRDYCAKNDTTYNLYESDLHNLELAIPEINRNRSNFVYGNLSDEFAEYGNTGIKIDIKGNIFEPANGQKGDVARTMMYMAETYHIPLTTVQMNTYKAWDKLDPVDSFERDKNIAIKKIQGNGNPYIK